jgi:hypothetical protein
VDSDLKYKGVDQVRELIEAAAAEARNTEEEEDAVIVLRARKYKIYLQRYLVQLFVKERIRDIDSDLANKLDSWGPAEAV